jgi:deoxyadenosine/deoxycytidine kinase
MSSTGSLPCAEIDFFCSAMFEKSGELDKSLNDIMVVLTMDPTHLKARIRRARIYEAQVSWRYLHTLLQKVLKVVLFCCNRVN